MSEPGGFLGREHSVQREQYVRRPWGGIVTGVLKNRKEAKAARAKGTGVSVGQIREAAKEQITWGLGSHIRLEAEQWLIWSSI